MARPIVALLLTLLVLLLPRPGPAVALTVAPTGPTEILSAGFYHTCALTPDDAVECWGANGNDQAGNHAGPYSQVSAGTWHTCALTPDGAVECWGVNSFGQADNHTGPYTQVSAGFAHTCALTPDGTVECRGSDFYGQVGGVNGVHTGPYSQVSAGIYHTCALTTLGAVECWGSNDDGQAGGANGYHTGPYGQVSAGGYHTCALTATGAAECWGWNDDGQVGGINGVHTGPYSQVSAGGAHTCALTPAGAVECWGLNDAGQAGNHAGPYTQVSAGGYHTCALTTLGVVECWGSNSSSQAGNHAGPYGPYVPETSITAAPDALTNNNNPSFSFTSPDPNAAFECQLDGGAWTACTSPTSYTDLADGEHTFEVRAVSPPGNPDPTPASYTWTIDTTDVFVSASAAGTTGDGVAFGPEDILKWDADGWSVWFDGTAAGLTPNGKSMHNLNALWMPDTAGDDVVLAFGQNARAVPGISGKVDGMDLVWWNGSAFSLWFDGQDVGLTQLTNEKIDALHVLAGGMAPPALAAAAGGSCDAYLLISTQASGKVPNYAGGEIKFDGTDVLGFCMTQSGSVTQGKWTRVLSGKAEGMPSQALTGLSASDDGQVLYLTTRATFRVDSATGGHSMVYRFDFASGQFSGPFFSAPIEGLNQKVGALQVDGELP